VQFSGLSSNDSAGLSLYGPPVVGSTRLEYWQHDNPGWTLQTNSLGSADFGAQLVAVSAGVTIAPLVTQTNVDCGNDFIATRSWQALDACGNAAICSQTVSVFDHGPPLILTQPVSQSLQLGATATFQAIISSCPPLSYQWYFNQTNLLAQATNPQLVLNNLSPDQAGAYSVVIANGFGSVTSAPAILIVGGAPLITSPPLSQVVAFGDTVSFSVTAQGDPPLNYQWYFNQTNLVSKANSSTLVLSPVTAALIGTYEVVVANQFGSVTSPPALLTVIGRPFILNQPANQLARNGDSATFSVIAQGSDPLTYQWYYNGTNVLLGATSSTLTLSGVTADQAGAYTVVISNPYGSTTSNPAQLHVVSGPTLTCAANRTVEVGTAWDFTVPGVTGTNPVLIVVNTITNPGCGQTLTATRTWSVTDDTGFQATCSQTVVVVDTTPPVLSCSPDKTVTFGSAWTFDTPSAQDAGGTVVVITPTVLSTQTNTDCGNGFTAKRAWQAVDACGNSSTCSQTVSVVDQGPPTILTQPHNQALPIGMNATFTVLVSSCPPLTYQWYFNQTTSLDSQTNASLILTNLTAEQAGIYTVLLLNNHGSVTSAPAQLDVGLAPSIITDPISQSATSGDTVVFTVNAGGTGPLSYQWYFNGTQPLANQTSSSLTLNNVTPAQTGGYSVVVSNEFGTVTSGVAQLSVGGIPVIITNPQSQVVTSGGTASFSVLAQGTTPFAYQWFFNVTNTLTDQTNATLVLNNVAPAQAGTYSVVVTNRFGSASSLSAQLSVLLLPFILVPPASQTVPNGATVLFTVSAQGAGTLGYQWFFNATNRIAGAISPTLTLNNVGAANIGDYSVLITNAVGTIMSPSASLRVLIAPQILSFTQNGNLVTLTFSTVPGLLYEVYYKENLFDPNWIVLPKKATLRLGTGAPLSVQDVIGTGLSRFYVIIAQ
jgi:hypothetical protein